MPRKNKYALSNYYQSGKSHAIAGEESMLMRPNLYEITKYWTPQQKQEYRYGHQAGKRMLSYKGPTPAQKRQQANFRLLGLLTKTQANLTEILKHFANHTDFVDKGFIHRSQEILQTQVNRIRADK